MLRIMVVKKRKKKPNIDIMFNFSSIVYHTPCGKKPQGEFLCHE